MGVFLLAGDTERAIVVVTRPLPPPEASPPSERLRLSIEQKKILELFEVEWQEWRNHIDEAWF
jgi:hypothetical protein